MKFIAKAGKFGDAGFWLMSSWDSWCIAGEGSSSGSDVVEPVKLDKALLVAFVIFLVQPEHRILSCVNQQP